MPELFTYIKVHVDKSSTPRSKGAVICMKLSLSAIDRENYIVPVWMI